MPGACQGVGRAQGQRLRGLEGAEQALSNAVQTSEHTTCLSLAALYIITIYYMTVKSDRSSVCSATQFCHARCFFGSDFSAASVAPAAGENQSKKAPGVCIPEQTHVLT